MEQAADWDARWRAEPLDPAAAEREERTPRWKAQEGLVRDRLGGFAGLRVIELGSGRGLNGLLFARRGADVTLLDRSPVALEQARELFAAHEVDFRPLELDIFDLPTDLGGFDLAMSFGLCEHFLGERRRRAVAAHLELVRPGGGLVLLGVPNRHAPAYRLWMGTLKRRGTWPLGTEEPFSASELEALARAAGGAPLDVAFGSFVASVVNFGVNQLLFKVGRRGIRVPQTRLPGLDRLAYELLLPVVRP